MLKHSQIYVLTSQVYSRRADLKRGEVECIVEHIDGHLCFAFRGTEVTGMEWDSRLQQHKSRLVDIINDVRFLPKHYPGIGVCHRGFAIGLGGGGFGLAEKVIRKFGRQHLKRSRIVVSGHSKGGGDGQTFAARLIAEGIPVEQVVCFGSPKVWVDGHCNLLREDGPSDIALYRHGNDIVTRLAPGWIVKYRHLVEQKQLGDAYVNRWARWSDWSYHPLPLYKLLDETEELAIAA